jgi:hypothetical protein
MKAPMFEYALFCPAIPNGLLHPPSCCIISFAFFII